VLVSLGCLICVQSLFADALDNMAMGKPASEWKSSTDRTRFTALFCQGKFRGRRRFPAPFHSGMMAQVDRKRTATNDTVERLLFMVWACLWRRQWRSGWTKLSPDGVHGTFAGSGTTQFTLPLAYGNGLMWWWALMESSSLHQMR